MSRKRNNTIYALFYCSNIVWSIIFLESGLVGYQIFLYFSKLGKMTGSARKIRSAGLAETLAFFQAI